jgi:thermitase
MVSHLSRPSWKLLVATLLALSLTIGPLASAGAFGPGDTADALVPGQILVQFKPGTAAWDRAGLHASLGVKSKGTIPQIDVEIVGVPAGRSAEGLIRMYEKNPNVVFAEPDGLMQETAVPNDPYFTRQWAHSYVRTPAAWDVTTGSNAVTIAVLDTGVELSHPDLAGRIVPGFDFINNDNDPSDDRGHGTRVTGIAAATGNNGMGVAGMDWNSRIMPVKVLDSTGNGSWSAISAGVTYAADKGAQVINMSLGGTSSSSTLQSAVRYAYGKGCTVVAATGNESSEVPLYPAAYTEVIAVGSVYKDVISSFSNYGAHVELVAPGDTIDSIAPGGGYGRITGTSAATPFVSGLAALLYSAKPGIQPAEVRAAMKASARDLGAAGWDKYYGWGHIDAAAALAAIGAGAPAPAPEPTVDEPVVSEPAPEPVPEPAPAPEPAPEAPSPEPIPEDRVAPSVQIVSPTDGSTVSGLVTVRAEATDSSGITRVEFYANGILIGTSNSAPYSMNWNTKKLSGQYVLTAVAVDTASNSATSAVVIVTVGEAVKNVPPPKKK